MDDTPIPTLAEKIRAIPNPFDSHEFRNAFIMALRAAAALVEVEAANPPIGSVHSVASGGAPLPLVSEPGATAEGLRTRLESLRSWITSLNDEAPAIRNQAAILINDKLAALASLVSMWVSVEDRLPDPDVEVLVWIATPTWADKPYAAVEMWAEQREDPTGMGGPTIVTGCGWSDNEFEHITHWMPLPAAPQAQMSGSDVNEASTSLAEPTHRASTESQSVSADGAGSMG